MSDPVYATPLTVPQADALRRGLPLNTPQMQREQAELQDLRWVAYHVLSSHDRSAAKLADRFPEQALSHECPCALCRHSRPWVGQVSAHPATSNP